MQREQTDNFSQDLHSRRARILLENWKNLLAGTLPVWNGMINSIIVAGFSAVLSVYFSTMTAYAIHAYDFGLKNSFIHSS